MPHFAAMCITNHHNFRSRFSLVFFSLICVYCLDPLQSTWKLLLYLRKQNSQRSSLGLSWIYTFTREVGGITVSTHLSLNTLVSLEEASGSIKLCEFYSPLPRCPFPGFCSFPQKVSSLFIWVSALLIFPFIFVLSTFDVLSKMLRISLNDSQSFSQHGLGIWKTISFSPLPSIVKTFFVSRHYPFYFSFLFFSEKKNVHSNTRILKSVFSFQMKAPSFPPLTT